jgi:hypothetical protein
MGGMQLDDDPKKNEPEVLHRALRGLLPLSYPNLQANIVAIISEIITGEISNGSFCEDGKYLLTPFFPRQGAPLISARLDLCPSISDDTEAGCKNQQPSVCWGAFR